MKDLANKVSVVTGGASGIGKAISEKFAFHGATVHILELNEASAKRLVNEINSSGGKAISHLCNVSKSAEVQSVIDEISKGGNIDILVNNAGIAHIGNIENTTEDDLDKLYQVNVKGVYNVMQAVIPFMKKTGKGCILNMASIAASVGLSDRFAYSMSKGAVLTMTYSVAKDYVNDGIRCNCISPARIHTSLVDGFIKENYPGIEKEMFKKLAETQPIGRMGLPDEIAELSLFLCSDKASFITGTNYPIDGGFIKLNG